MDCSRNVLERQVFPQPRRQEQAGRFGVPAMRVDRRGAIVSPLDAAWPVRASDHSIQNNHASLLNGQHVSLPCEQELAKALMKEKNALTAQRLLALERLALAEVSAERLSSLAQSLRRKSKRRAIVAVPNWMRYAVGFVAIEEQNLIRVRHEFPAPMAPHEHAAAHKDNLVRLSRLLSAALTTMGPASHVRDGNDSAAMKPGNM